VPILMCSKCCKPVADGFHDFVEVCECIPISKQKETARKKGWKIKFPKKLLTNKVRKNRLKEWEKLRDDFESIMRTKEAWKEIKEGKCETMEKEEFLERMKKWMDSLYEKRN